MFHLDQCNIPTERELKCFVIMLKNIIIRAKRAIHCVSLPCQSLDYQKIIARRMRDLDIGVIICPSALFQ